MRKLKDWKGFKDSFVKEDDYLSWTWLFSKDLPNWLKTNAISKMPHAALSCLLFAILATQAKICYWADEMASYIHMCGVDYILKLD